MSPIKQFFSLNGILARSIIVTVLTFVLVGIATVAYTVQAARSEAERDSQTRLGQLLETVQSTLRVACFVKDRELAREVALGLLSNTEVLRVTIHEGVQILADIQRNANGQLPEQASKDSLLRDIRSPFVDSEVIGQIRLTPNPEIIERQIRQDIVDRTRQLAWQLALIAGAMVVTLLVFIIQPISAMSRALHRMDPTTGDRLPIPAGHTKTEIGRLANDVNALAGRLVQALDEEHALRLQREVDERKYHALFDNAESGIFIVDCNGSISSWNPALARLLGIAQAEDFAGKLQLTALPWEHPEAVEELFTRTFLSHAPGTLDTPIRRIDQTQFWLNIVLNPIGNNLLQGVAHDVSALKEAEAQARRQALTDSLTGLANRPGLEQQLHQLVKQQRLGQSQGFTLVYIDLDKFRLVIEGLGVPAGDEILRAVGARLSAAVKRNDILARLSADIFVAVLQNLSDDESIDKIVERLMHSLRHPYMIDGSPIHLTASIGITLFPNDGGDAPSLLRNAELASHKAKAEGGNHAVYFDPTLAESAEQRRHLESDLRQAIREQQFVLFYQPIVDLQGNRLAGAEALIRWRHPERGLVQPDHFIPIVEQSGLINEIGLWVLETACAQIAIWETAGLDYYLSINVSGRQIPNGLPPSAVAEAIARHAIDPGRLALEITEGILLDNIVEAQHWLQAVQQLGVRLYLDDFGTGYSSLSYLKRFPLDTLKIDRSFVQDMEPGNNEHSLVEAIIAMARSLGLKVVAEGVESATHLDMLRAMGCHCAQGYHLSRPMPAEDFPQAVEHVAGLLARPPVAG